MTLAVFGHTAILRTSRSFNTVDNQLYRQKITLFEMFLNCCYDHNTYVMMVTCGINLARARSNTPFIQLI